MPLAAPFRREKLAPSDSPVAPIVDVLLRHNHRSRSYPALIDTGAQTSTISAKALRFMQPQKRGAKPVAVAADTRDELKCDFYRIDELHFAGRTYKNHPLFLVTQRDEEMIIGRDILQFHVAHFNGPAEELSIE